MGAPTAPTTPAPASKSPAGDALGRDLGGPAPMDTALSFQRASSTFAIVLPMNLPLAALQRL